MATKNIIFRVCIETQNVLLCGQIDSQCDHPSLHVHMSKYFATLYTTL